MRYLPLLLISFMLFTRCKSREEVRAEYKLERQVEHTAYVKKHSKILWIDDKLECAIPWTYNGFSCNWDRYNEERIKGED